MIQLKFIVEVVKAEPVYDKRTNELTQYDLAFDIREENGVALYTPATVYPYELQNNHLVNDLAGAIEYAMHSVLPAQVRHMLGVQATQQPDFFDTLARSLERGNDNPN